MDFSTIVNILAVLGSLATILAFPKSGKGTLLEAMKEHAQLPELALFILASLFILLISIIWWLLHSSSSDNMVLKWYDMLTIGLFASAISLSVSRTAWRNVIGNAISGIIGAFIGWSYVDPSIHAQNFTTHVIIVFASALALITLWHLVWDFLERLSSEADGNGESRITIGILLAIIVVMGCIGLYASALTNNMRWYHWVLSGLAISTLSLLIPFDYALSLFGETFIGPLGALIGFLLVTKTSLYSHDFYHNIGVMVTCALVGMITTRIIGGYYQRHRKDVP